MRLRTPPSGPETIGTVENDRLAWDNTAKAWVVRGTQVLPFVSVLGVAVAALAAAGDSQVVSLPVAGSLVGDMALIISTTLAAAGVVVNGNGVCLVNGTISVEVTATKAYAGANEDFTLKIVR